MNKPARQCQGVLCERLERDQVSTHGRWQRSLCQLFLSLLCSECTLSFLHAHPPLCIVKVKHHLWPPAEAGGTSNLGVPPPEQRCDFSLSVTFLCPQRMLGGLNTDRCRWSLRSPPIQTIPWFCDSCFPKMCSLHFQLHHFTLAISLNSFFLPQQEGDEEKQLSHNCCQFLAD